jgi:hydroxymethylpyrimidine pyrophosphatase-like HAD family hydrolase
MCVLCNNMHNFNLKNLFYKFKTTMSFALFLFSLSHYYAGGRLILLQNHSKEKSIFARDENGNISTTYEKKRDYRPIQDLIKNSEFQNQIIGSISDFVEGALFFVISETSKKLNELQGPQEILGLKKDDIMTIGDNAYLSYYSFQKFLELVYGK